MNLSKWFMRVRFSLTQLKINKMTENTKWNFKNSRFLGKIEGKLYTLKQMTNGFCSNDNPLIEKIEEIEELVKKIEL